MNHIEQILRDLDVTSDNASSARWFRLGIRAICALATEARGIGNLMAWGARAERIPAEAGEMAQDFDRELSVAGRDCSQADAIMHDYECAQGLTSAHWHADDCMACRNRAECPDRVRLPRVSQPLAQDFGRELSEVSGRDCSQVDVACEACPDHDTCIHLPGSDDLLCSHIYTGHQHDEPMTQIQDSRDSAGFPRP